MGADAFASDLNPVAVLLNKVVLEYIPKYGQRLADEVRKWGEWIKREAEKELAEFYPKDPDGSDADRLSLGTDDPVRRPRLRCGSAAHPYRFGWPRKATAPWPCSLHPKSKRWNSNNRSSRMAGWTR